MCCKLRTTLSDMSLLLGEAVLCSRPLPPPPKQGRSESDEKPTTEPNRAHNPSPSQHSHFHSEDDVDASESLLAPCGPGAPVDDALHIHSALAVAAVPARPSIAPSHLMHVLHCRSQQHPRSQCSHSCSDVLRSLGCAARFSAGPGHCYHRQLQRSSR